MTPTCVRVLCAMMLQALKVIEEQFYGENKDKLKL